MVEMKDVVAKLAKLTERGQVPWKTTVDISTFSATFGNLSVLISSQPSPPGPDISSYRLSVLDEKGSEIDYATTRYGPSVVNVRLPALVPLYTAAKRTALGVDRRLEELMGEVNLISDC